VTSGELYPRADLIVTDLAPPAERVVAFYNQRGRVEQWIREGRARSNGPGCRAAPSLPTPSVLSSIRSPAIWRCRKTAEPWSLTSLREKLIKIGAKVVGHGRHMDA